MTDRPRQSYSLDQINSLLIDQIESVVARYAPAAPGAYRNGHLYFTLNPGRPDRTVGSFCIDMAGPTAGRWRDYASDPRGGDLIDLIGLSQGLRPADAIREARAFLGLDHETPELRRAREAAAERARAQRAEAAAREARRREDEQRRAAGLWLSARPEIKGSPADHYLAARGLDLRQLGRQPGALRYHADTFFFHQATDPETGEVHTIRRKLPAMLGCIVNGAGRIIGCHRTYLAIDPATGHWAKARLADPVTGQPLPAKKVMGEVKGGCIRISNGIGARGGKAAALNQCPPGTRVLIAEGIETALTALFLQPQARVIAAVALGNMGAVDLPANVAEVVLIADHDESPEAQAAFARAVEAHQKKGRAVRVWRSDVPGEDLNDTYRRTLARQDQEGAA